MKGEERFDSTTKGELTRALAQKGVIKRNKIGGWHTYKEHAGTNTKRGEGDMQRPGMTC